MANELETPTREQISEAVCQQLELLRARDSQLPRVAVELASSVMTDLGFDSISLLELLVGIEGQLGVSELPMNEWLAQQSENEGMTYRVDSLVHFIHERAASAARARQGAALDVA